MEVSGRGDDTGGRGLPEALAPDGPAVRRKQALWKRVLRTAVALGVVVLIFAGFLPQLADFSEVWTAIGDMSSAQIVVILVASFVPMAAYWVALMAVIPGLRLPQAAVAHLTGTAIANTVPAGGAVALGAQFTEFTSWGFTISAATSGLLLVGIGDQLMKFGVPILTAVLAALFGRLPDEYGGLVLVGLAILIGAVVLLVLVFRSERFACRLGSFGDRLATPVLALLGRGSAELETRVPRFRRDTVGVIRHRWPGWIGGIFVSHLSLYLVLLLSLRAVGVESHQVDALRVLVAFAITRLLTAVPVTPGGIGIAEASYIALLSAGLDDQETVNLVTAGVLVFRALTYLLPIPLGGLSWLYWTVDERWRRPPGSVDARLGA